MIYKKEIKWIKRFAPIIEEKGVKKQSHKNKYIKVI